VNVIAWVIVLAIAAAFSFAWWRSRNEVLRLRRRLEAAGMELERLQISFSRFAPEQVIERIIASGVPTTGEKKEVTILFADLVGFTALSERVEPSELVRILNGYFQCMSAAIHEHRGYVSTLVGDGILALFGALEPNPWQANDSAHAALAMREALADYNEELARQDFPALELGIGVHRGPGITGLVGSRDLMEFTVVGRTINLAARVQDLTRTLDSDIIVTEAVREALDPRFILHSLPAQELKGISGTVQVHGVEGWQKQA
jgi:class 3 adenylate cyclase